MASQYILPVAVCFLFALVNGQNLPTVDGRIKITVGTTAGCSDTMRFINNDLAVTYELYKDYLDIEFIPWGRTVRNANNSLTCQFGVNDCWANRNHRCALQMLEGDLEAQMHYMRCEFSPPYPAYIQGSYICAHAVGLSLVDLDYCVTHPNDEVDLEAERRGTEMTLALNFVPAVVFNDVIDLTLHTQSLSNLVSMICFALAQDSNSAVTDCSL